MTTPYYYIDKLHIYISFEYISMNDLLISKLALTNQIIQQKIVGPGLNQTNIAIRYSAKKIDLSYEPRES